ncbi:MAG: apolipoprotein N-acyltransferase [Chthoniobacterales bacterium]
MNWTKTAARMWPWLAAATSGVLYRACFAPFDQAWLCWIALTPLLAAVWFSGPEAKGRARQDLLLGYAAGLTFFWSVFSWLTTVTVPGWFLVGGYMGIYLAIWSWLAGMLRPRVRKPKAVRGLEAVTQRLEEKRAASARSGALQPAESQQAAAGRAPLLGSPWLSSTHNLRLAFLLASAWVALEFLRGTLFSGWGWNMLGTALHAQWALIQIVEITGVAGLSFLVAFTNVILLAFVRRFILETQVRPLRPHYDLTLTMVAIVGVISFGIRAVQMKQESKSIRVAAVQPNVPREQKFRQEFAEITFDQFSRLSHMAMQEQRPDLLIWPESSMPDPVLPDTESYRFVKEFAQATKVDLLLGVIDQDEAAAYNAALLVTEGGTREQRYRKVHLVPFGEYVPGRHFIPGLARIVGDQVPDDFGFGREHTVFRTSDKEVQLAPLICFEDTIGELTRQFVLGGANLLANVTNDGWFLRSAGSQQHLDNAVFRCVETRLPMVRSANTGITCFINEFGRVTTRWPQFTEGVLSGNVAVPVRPRQTFYLRHGELFSKICAGVTGLTLLVLMALHFQKRREVRSA